MIGERFSSGVGGRFASSAIGQSAKERQATKDDGLPFSKLMAEG
jgi:hypothetical protein